MESRGRNSETDSGLRQDSKRHVQGDAETVERQHDRATAGLSSPGPVPSSRVKLIPLHLAATGCIPHQMVTVRATMWMTTLRARCSTCYKERALLWAQNS